MLFVEISFVKSFFLRYGEKRNSYARVTVGDVTNSQLQSTPVRVDVEKLKQYEKMISRANKKEVIVCPTEY